MSKTYTTTKEQQAEQARIVQTIERTIGEIRTTRSAQIARERYVLTQKRIKTARENCDIDLPDARRLRDAADDAMAMAPCPWTMTLADRLIY
jgi:hypothetical protein